MIQDLHMILNDTLNNKIVSTLISMFLVVYGGMAMPPPNSVIKLFNIPLFRIFMIALIAVLTKASNSNGLMATISFILTLNIINRITYRRKAIPKPKPTATPTATPKVTPTNNSVSRSNNSNTVVGITDALTNSGSPL